MSRRSGATCAKNRGMIDDETRVLHASEHKMTRQPSPRAAPRRNVSGWRRWCSIVSIESALASSIAISCRCPQGCGELRTPDPRGKHSASLPCSRAGNVWHQASSSSHSASQSALCFIACIFSRVAFESWVGAMAAAPLVLAYPLFLGPLFGRSALTIIVMSFLVGLAPSSQDHRGPVRNAARAHQCRPQFQADTGAAVLEDHAAFGTADDFRRHSSRADVRLIEHHRGRVFDAAALGQLINDLAERREFMRQSASSFSSALFLRRHRKG